MIDDLKAGGAPILGSLHIDLHGTNGAWSSHNHEGIIRMSILTPG